MKAILAVVLSLGIAIPVPAYSATFSSNAGKAPQVSFNSSAAGAVTIKLNVAPVTMKTGANLAPTLKTSSLELDPKNVQAQVALNPVYAQIQALKSQGLLMPDAIITRTDAAEVMKIAATMPQGKLRDNMLLMAKMAELGSSAGSGNVNGSELTAAYDHSVPDDTPLVSAPTGAQKFWSFVSRIPGLKAWAGAKAGSNGGKTGLRPVKALTAEQVRFVPPPSIIPQGGTKDIPLADKKIVGQELAEQAFLFGAKMPGDNYNIYVSGPDGSGRETMVRQVLDAESASMKNPGDVVAATNFENEEKPVILELLPGQGEALKGAVDNFIKVMQRVLPQVLTSGETASSKKAIHSKYEAAAAQRLKDINEWLATLRFAGVFGVTLEMEMSEGGQPSAMIIPTFEGQPLTPDEIEKKIEGGQIAAAVWEQAQQELSAAAEGEIGQRIQDMVAKNEEEHAAAHEEMDAYDAMMAKVVAKKVGASLLGSLSTSHEGDADHTALHERHEQRISEINADAAKTPTIDGYGFQIVGVKTPQGLMYVPTPTKDGVPLQDMDGMTEEQFEGLAKKLTAAAKPFMTRLQAAMKLFNEEHQAIHENAPKPSAEAVQYLNKLVAHAARNYPIFLGALKQGGQGPDGMKQIGKQDEPSDFFRVSVLVNNAETKGAPVIWEKNPTYENLFGFAESNARTMLLPGAGLMKAQGAGGPTLKAGSFLKARGGFLVLNVMDVLREPGAWQALMAAVKTGQAEISEGGLLGLASMKGEKYFVPGKTKVVLIGAPMIKMLLQHYDEDFSRAFSVTSEFEPSLAISNKTIEGYLYFIKKIVASGAGEILDLSHDAISTVIEFSARLVDSNKKLTAQFGVLYGLLREASFWATQAGNKVVTTNDINNALMARDQRENVYQRHMRDLYNEDIFTVHTKDGKAGQINGLAVMGAFGVPMRITIINTPGEFNIVSNDQNAGTTGSSFNKSLEVSKGFIAYAMGPKRRPKGQVRVSFEQNYGGIDGDSATSTMLYGILSSLSGVKIKQNMAVTGSADQFGTVQAIGGVNEKVEGFFDLVAYRGQLSKDNPPTVLVPATNVRDLQLRPDVAAAIKAGTFRVIAINNVMQGIEQLTGVPYAEVMAKVQARMASL